MITLLWSLNVKAVLCKDTAISIFLNISQYLIHCVLHSFIWAMPHALAMPFLWIKCILWEAWIKSSEMKSRYIPPGYRVLEMSFKTSNAFLINILSMGDLHCKWGRGEVVGICTGTHPPHMSNITGGDESRKPRRTPGLQHPYAWTSHSDTWSENW